MSAEFFIWYRLDSAEIDPNEVQARAHAFMQELYERCGVQGRLLKRTEAVCTWMEHYALKSPNEQHIKSFQSVLDELVKTLWLPPLPQRHTECFELIERHLA